MPSFIDGKFYDDDGKELTQDDLITLGVQMSSKCAECNRPRDNWKTHPSLCPVCLVNLAEQGQGHTVTPPKCRFVGKREWGIGPAEPWRICQACGQSKAQHELPSCTSILTIAGAPYPCDLNMPHEGWGHSNKEAQAIWA